MPTNLFLAILLAAAAAVAMLAARERPVDSAALQAEAAALTREYGASLLGVLKGAIETSGPVGAVGF